VNGFCGVRFSAHPISFKKLHCNKEETNSRKEKNMFNFRIINVPDGTQVIDPSLKTPYNALTLDQMQEYMEIDSQITTMERMKRKARREAGRKRKVGRNPLHRIACKFGLA